MAGRTIGLILLAMGAVLFVVGLIAADSAGEQLTKTFTGEFTDRTTFYILGGMVSAIVGAGMAFIPRRETS